MVVFPLQQKKKKKKILQVIMTVKTESREVFGGS